MQIYCILHSVGEFIAYIIRNYMLYVILCLRRVFNDFIAALCFSYFCYSSSSELLSCRLDSLCEHFSFLFSPSEYYITSFVCCFVFFVVVVVVVVLKSQAEKSTSGFFLLLALCSFCISFRVLTSWHHVNTREVFGICWFIVIVVVVDKVIMFLFLLLHLFVRKSIKVTVNWCLRMLWYYVKICDNVWLIGMAWMWIYSQLTFKCNGNGMRGYSTAHPCDSRHKLLFSLHSKVQLWS